MIRQQFSDDPELDPSQAEVHLLPVPLEATVSYGGGTNRGPHAILEASYQLENYDREFDCEPGQEYGIHTLAALELPSDQQSAIGVIEKAVREAYKPDRLLGVLGGEHSLTAPVVRGVTTHVGQPITIVQLDAHCDLRDAYEDSKLSHASVASRMLENPLVEQILQLGIRSLCTEEANVLKNDSRVRAWFAEDIHSGAYLREFTQRVKGRKVYLTIDVDCFDPSIMPSTGTPEPDGLSYRQAEEIVRVVVKNSEILAFDCVELAPVEGFHAADFLVAKFLAKLMNLCRVRDA